MNEYIINLHMHTPFSDGHGTHKDIAKAAIKSDIDGVIITDHNVLVKGMEGYYEENGNRVLMLVGEEVHDQDRDPQKNHLLVIGTDREVSQFAADPQKLIDTIHKAGGLSFIAHPHDPSAPLIGEDDLNWVNWEVKGYTGIELWNGLSEMKARLKSPLHALWYGFQFARVGRGPQPETLPHWDELLSTGVKVVAVGGSDAHAIPFHWGPFTRNIFPYEQHFKAVNTHILTPEPFSGDFSHDKQLVLDALIQGHVFVGYDLPAPTNGFRFTAHSKEHIYWMGDEISIKDGLTLQVHLPQGAEGYLLKDGRILGEMHKRNALAHAVKETGVYRVEVYRRFKGLKRAWIFSNPIYIR